MADGAITSLAPVIVGGLLTMGGGLIAGGFQLAVRHLQLRDDNKKQRAVKFEELVCVLHEHQHWMNRARNIRVFGDAGELGQSPINKAVAITSVYFPEHYEKLHRLDMAADNYEVWMMKGAQKRLRGQTSNLLDGHEEAMRDYNRLFHDFLAELRKFAKTDL